MFLTSKDYTNAIRTTMTDSESLSIAVAFWGLGSEKLFQSPSGKKMRIICNLTSGGTNPQVIKKLIELQDQKIEIRQLNTLHAKVVVGDTCAVIGSANFSTNGLCLEGQECSGWAEVGYQVTGPGDVAAVQEWFEGTWTKATQIDEDDLQLAQDNWDSRSHVRVFQKKDKRSKLIDNLIKLNAYVVVWREPLSEEAKGANEKVIGRIKNKNSEETNSTLEDNSEQHSCYESWDQVSADKKQKLPKNRLLIDIFYPKDGKFKVQEIWRRNGFDCSFTYPKDGRGTTVGVVMIDTWDELDSKFEKSDKEKLESGIAAFIKSLDPENPHVCVPLSEAMSLY